MTHEYIFACISPTSPMNRPQLSSFLIYAFSKPPDSNPDHSNNTKIRLALRHTDLHIQRLSEILHIMCLRTLAFTISSGL